MRQIFLTIIIWSLNAPKQASKIRLHWKKSQFFDIKSNKPCLIWKTYAFCSQKNFYTLEILILSVGMKNKTKKNGLRFQKIALREYKIFREPFRDDSDTFEKNKMPQNLQNKK